MAIEVDYNGFTFEFPDETSDAEIYSFLEQNADSMASEYEEPAPKEEPLQRPFYEMGAGDGTKPSDAFTDPSLDLSGKTVESQEGVSHYVEGYTSEGKIDPRSSRWKGMNGNQIEQAQNQDIRDGVINGHVRREGPAYDMNAQVAGVSRDEGITERQVELEEKNPTLSKQELFEKADSEQKIDGLKTVGQAALMLTPAGHGLKGMTVMGALAGAGDEALEVVADAAKGNRDLLDTDNLLDVVEGGAYGGVLGGVFGGVVKGAEKLLDFAKGGKKVTQEVADLAEEYGIKLTPGQKVDSKTIKYLEDFTAEGFGGKSITKAREDQVKAAEEVAKKEAVRARDSLVDDFYAKDPEVQVLQKSRDDINVSGEELAAVDQRMSDIWNDASRKVDEDGVILHAVPNAMKERSKTLGDAFQKSTREIAEASTNFKTPDLDSHKMKTKDWEEFTELSDSKLIKSLSRKEFGEEVWSALRSGPSKDSKVEKFVKVINDSPDSTKVKKAMTVKFSEDAVVAGNRSGEFVVGDYVKFLKDNNIALKHFNKETFARNQGLIKLMDVIAKGEKASAASASNPMMGLLSKFAPSVLGGAIGGTTGGWEGAAAGMAGGALGRYSMAKVLLPLIGKSPEKFSKVLEKKSIQSLLVQLAKAVGDKAKVIEDKLIKALIIELDVEA